MHRLYSTSSNWNTQHLGGSSSWIFKCWQLVYCHHTIIIKLWNMYINLFNTSLKAYHMINFWLSTSSEISIHISLTQMQLKLILIFLEYSDVIVLLLTWQLWGLGRWCVGFPRGVANQSDRPKPGWQLTNQPNISLTAPSIKMSLHSNKRPAFLFKSARNWLKRTSYSMSTL